MRFKTKQIVFYTISVTITKHQYNFTFLESPPPARRQSEKSKMIIVTMKTNIEKDILC